MLNHLNKDWRKGAVYIGNSFPLHIDAKNFLIMVFRAAYLGVFNPVGALFATFNI